MKNLFKSLIVTSILVALSGGVLAQVFVPAQANRTDTIEYERKTSAITVGILNGGGSLIGADLEILVSPRAGFQLGAGLIGYGAGLTYHIKRDIRSSYLLLQYINQGVGETFAQNAVGVSYVYRGKKWLTFQLGLAATLDQGPAWPSHRDPTPVMLMYSIGGYIPF